MTDQQAREFVEMLAVPQDTDPPPCPICGFRHQLEAACALPQQDGPASARAPRETLFEDIAAAPEHRMTRQG